MVPKIGSAEDRKCPKCGQEGEFVNRREWHLGKASRPENEFKCKTCGTEWHRPAKD